MQNLTQFDETYARAVVVERGPTSALGEGSIYGRSGKQ